MHIKKILVRINVPILSNNKRINENVKYIEANNQHYGNSL